MNQSRRFAQRRALLLCWLLCGALALVPAHVRAADPVNVGTVDHVTGLVTITDPNGQSRPATVGTVLNEGDSVATGDDGEVLFKMVDSGAIALRPKTQMRVTQYQFKSQDNDSSILNIARGSMRVLTGLIGKLHPNNASVRTPTATIGIRGTDHETLVQLEDTPDGSAGTYERVFEGSTFIEQSGGERLPVEANQVGYSPRDALKTAQKLGILPGVPKFFITGKFDDLFAALAQALQNRLEDKLLNKVPTPMRGLIQNNLPSLGDIFKHD